MQYHKGISLQLMWTHCPLLCLKQAPCSRDACQALPSVRLLLRRWMPPVQDHIAFLPSNSIRRTNGWKGFCWGIFPIFWYDFGLLCSVDYSVCLKVSRIQEGVCQAFHIKGSSWFLQIIDEQGREARHGLYIYICIVKGVRKALDFCVEFGGSGHKEGGTLWNEFFCCHAWLKLSIKRKNTWLFKSNFWERCKTTLRSQVKRVIAPWNGNPIPKQQVYWRIFFLRSGAMSVSGSVLAMVVRCDV